MEPRVGWVLPTPSASKIRWLFRWVCAPIKLCSLRKFEEGFSDLLRLTSLCSWLCFFNHIFVFLKLFLTSVFSKLLAASHLAFEANGHGMHSTSKGLYYECLEFTTPRCGANGVRNFYVFGGGSQWLQWWWLIRSENEGELCLHHLHWITGQAHWSALWAASWIQDGCVGCGRPRLRGAQGRRASAVGGHGLLQGSVCGWCPKSSGEVGWFWSIQIKWI